ncbi:MAG TPA: 4-hydroxythreonine-4-phosphate dehydrogenase PdxA, partial [Balneolaceae bacterium]|nr:4-hydroxythreonine-4-phosphate dehydrogenase PdxA [Balneolaceae bacterium]
IILKSLTEDFIGTSTPVILSPPGVIDFYCGNLGFENPIHSIDNIDQAEPGKINVLDPLKNEKTISVTPGYQTEKSGLVAMKAIEMGIELCTSGSAQALVTAPISKEAVNLAGYNIPGHTEFLATQTGTQEVLMMLVSGDLRVSLVTTHIPIREVAQKISAALIERKLEILSQSLKEDFGIEKPKIAVFGLNPHAGDGGVIGREEMDLITPLLKKLQPNIHNTIISGPFPADGFFGQQLHKEFDAILAMYHDQGLAPFKLLSFGKGVNFTAELPIIRTSPDHGTAFDIAGKGMGNPSS